MKTLKSICIVLVFLLISSQDLFSQSLSISSNTIQVSALANTANITITSDTYWGIYNIPSWITVDTNWGNGNRTIKFTIQQNPCFVNRSSTITFYWLDANWANAGETTLNITQAASNYGVSDTLLQFSATAGSTAGLTIKTESYWEVDSLPTWLSIDKNWQWIGQTVYFTATENPFSSSRSAIIYVKRLLTDGTYTEIPIIVKQAAPTNGISTYLVSVASPAGSPGGFAVSSIGSWSITGQKSWLSLIKSSSTGNDSVYVVAQANTTIYYRTDTLKITFSNGDIRYLVVSQDPILTTFLANPVSVSFAATASSGASIKVSSNTNWGITMFPSWINQTSFIGFGDSLLTLTASQNPFTIKRTGTAYAYWLDMYGLFQDDTTISITQIASSYGVSDTALSIGASSGSTKTFSITTDKYWEIVDLPSWLTVNKNYLTGTTSIQLTSTENPQSTIRTASFTVHRLLADGTYLNATVTVHQDAMQYGVSSELVSIGVASGSTASFEINAPSTWTISGLKTWLSIGTLKGSGKTTISLTAQENTTIYYKPDTLIITFASGKVYNVVVMQKPASTLFSISPWKLIFASSDKSTATVTVTSNSNWGIIKLPTWFYSSSVYDYGTKTITLSVMQNTTTQNRVDSLLTYWYDIDNNYYEQWIPVIQKAPSITQTINLVQGWNLISLNVEPSDSSIASIFNSMISDVLEIKNAESYYRSTNNSVFNTLKYLGQQKAYFVKMKNANTLKITGTPTIVLKNDIRNSIVTGWNFVGCPYQTSTAISNIFDITKVSTIKNTSSFYIPNGTSNTLNNFVPSSGYFVKKK